MKKADCDGIEGLSPAISIDQKQGSHNPRINWLQPLQKSKITSVFSGPELVNPTVRIAAKRLLAEQFKKS
jgi:hypothetical protein